jgi:hypothetical protein
VSGRWRSLHRGPGKRRLGLPRPFSIPIQLKAASSEGMYPWILLLLWRYDKITYCVGGRFCPFLVRPFFLILRQRRLPSRRTLLRGEPGHSRSPVAVARRRPRSLVLLAWEPREGVGGAGAAREPG